MNKINNYKKKAFLDFLIILIVCFCTSANAGDLSSKYSKEGDTVKSHLETAVNAARQWQSDTLLWQVSAGSFIRFTGDLLSCNTKVPQSGWTYYFWSPKTHMDHRVNICGQLIVPEGLGGNLHQEKEFIRGDFLDTNEVGKIIQKILDSNSCPLKGKHWEGRIKFNPGYSRPMWHANTMCSDIQYLHIVIDPITGKASSQLMEETP